MNHIDARYWFPSLPWRRMSGAESTCAQIKFAPQLAISRDDGWNDLELRLLNRSSGTMWVEDASVVLANIDADRQAVVPSRQARHQILRNVGPNEILSVNLARPIYEAAGRPQGPFSCLLLAIVSYRVFN